MHRELTIGVVHESGRLITFKQCELLKRTPTNQLQIKYKLPTYNGTETIEETFNGREYTIERIELDV